ncbi:MAG: HAMP domain-containing histidine kinase [Ruminococcus sp.]|nr:HAMP domain-containing histidine kinase [Ruminococcus sp.]MDY3895661.1 HAMP domain-containing sensor histidine kinase [Candidatus Fimenecus sp.]
MIKKLRKKFIRITMLSVTAVMLLLCLTVNIANFISVNSEEKKMLTAISENSGRVPSAPPGAKDEHGKEPTEEPKKGQFTAETPYTTRYFILRFDNDGNLTRAELSNIASVTADDTGEYLDAALKKGSGFSRFKGYKFYVLSVGENRNMAIFLDCYQDMRSVYSTAAISLAAAAVCILIVYVTVVLSSRRAIDPVVKSSLRQKQFVTDAGHELKTPITVIATSLSVLEMEIGSNKWIDKARSQTEKLTELVNSLVTLSKADEEQEMLKFSEFDISSAVLETAESFSDFAEQKNHKLNISAENGIMYNGDEYAVRQLVSILLDNAVKYAADNSEIDISVARHKKGVIIKTRNRCDDISEGDCEKLFDRFYRPDKSRSASTGGFGIGLSVAKSIAEGHKGSISADCSEKGFITFSVYLK